MNYYIFFSLNKFSSQPAIHDQITLRDTLYKIESIRITKLGYLLGLSKIKLKD